MLPAALQAVNTRAGQSSVSHSPAGLCILLRNGRWAMSGLCCRTGRPDVLAEKCPCATFWERLGKHSMAVAPLQRQGWACMSHAPARPQHDLQGDAKQHTLVRGHSVKTFHSRRIMQHVSPSTCERLVPGHADSAVLYLKAGQRDLLRHREGTAQSDLQTRRACCCRHRDKAA